MVVCIHHSVFINKLLLTQYLADEKVLDIVHLFDLHKITVSICQTYDWYVPVIRAELVCTATNGITDYMKKIQGHLQQPEYSEERHEVEKAYRENCA